MLKMNDQLVQDFRSEAIKDESNSTLCGASSTKPVQPGQPVKEIRN